MAHTCAPADDRADAGRRCGLATICSGYRGSQIFSSHRYFVDHHQRSAFDPGAAAAARKLVWCGAGFVRRCDDHRNCLCHGLAGQQFQFAVLAGDYCCQHSFYAPGGVFHRGLVSRSTRGDDLVFLLGAIPKTWIGTPSANRCVSGFSAIPLAFSPSLTSPACWRTLFGDKAPNSRRSGKSCLNCRISPRTSSIPCAAGW